MVPSYPQVELGGLVENLDRLRVPVTKKDRVSGPYPYYGAAGIQDWVSDFLFDGRHLLVAEDGSVESASGGLVLQLVEGKIWVNNHAHVLRGATESDTRYIYYALHTVKARPYMTGAVQQKISQKNLNRIHIPFPEESEERQRIVAVLGALDDKIELNRKMNETLEEMAQAIFKSWFIDFDGHDPADLVDSELGPIPRGWEVRPIGEWARIVGGGTPSTKVDEYWEPPTYCWTTPKDLSNADCLWLLSTARKLSEQGISKVSSGLLPRGTFLLSSRAPVGYTALASMPLAVNQGYIAIPPQDKVSMSYLLFWARENLDAIKARAGGTTFAEISKRNFRPIPIIIPESGVLSRFDQSTAPLLAKIELNAKQAQLLSELRDTLLPKLISGELRVPETKEQVEAAL